MQPSWSLKCIYKLDTTPTTPPLASPASTQAPPHTQISRCGKANTPLPPGGTKTYQLLSWSLALPDNWAPHDGQICWHCTPATCADTLSVPGQSPEEGGEGEGGEGWMQVNMQWRWGVNLCACLKSGRNVSEVSNPTTNYQNFSWRREKCAPSNHWLANHPNMASILSHWEKGAGFLH